MAAIRHKFSFIVQKGPLEAQAVLLAASFHQHFKGEGFVEAVIPQVSNMETEPHPDTLEILQGCNVRVARRPNPILEGSDGRLQYLLSNKFICLESDPQVDFVSFLDTDTILTADFTGQDDRFRHDFLGYIAGNAGINAVGPHWETFAIQAGVSLPPFRIATSMKGGFLFHPGYCTSGYIGIRQDRASHLAQEAQRIFRVIEHTNLLGNEIYIEMVSVALAGFSLGLTRVLSPGQIKPMFHYIGPLALARSTSMSALVRRLLAAYPSVRTRLQDMLRNELAKGNYARRKRGWELLLQPAWQRVPRIAGRRLVGGKADP